MKKQHLLLALMILLLPAIAKANDDFKFKGTVKVFGGKVTQVTATRYVLSGCGADDQKCTCDYDSTTGKLTMTGRGTSGSSTGLDFTCNWQIYTTNGSCLIKWRADIPYSGDNGTNFVTTGGCPVDSDIRPKIPAPATTSISTPWSR